MQPAEDEIAERLNAMRPIDPPEDLKAAVMKEVRHRAITLETPFSPGLRRRRWFAAGWAAAAAFVLFVFLVGRSHLTDTGATMAPPGALQWTEVSRMPSQRGTLVIRRNGDFFSVEPVFPGPLPLTISMHWDPAHVEVIGVSDEKDASFGKATVKFVLRDPSQRAGVIVRPRSGASPAPVWVSVGTRLQ
jgi:hypothetical protein